MPAIYNYNTIMINKSVFYVFLILIAGILFCKQGLAQQSLADIPKERRSALDLAIDFESKERIAKESDMNSLYLASVKNKIDRQFKPYYTEGDFNGDGKDDFAVVYLKERESIGVSGKPNKLFVVISIFEADEKSERGYISSSQMGWEGKIKKRKSFYLCYL